MTFLVASKTDESLHLLNVFLGVPIAKEKTERPILCFLGLQIDAIEMVV